METSYLGYILASVSRMLHVGVTDDVSRRVTEHARTESGGFTARYRVVRLVYFEEFGGIHETIVREKQVNGWRRAKYIRRIGTMNPKWEDLSGFDQQR